MPESQALKHLHELAVIELNQAVKIIDFFCAK